MDRTDWNAYYLTQRLVYEPCVSSIPVMIKSIANYVIHVPSDKCNLSHNLHICIEIHQLNIIVIYILLFYIFLQLT